MSTNWRNKYFEKINCKGVAINNGWNRNNFPQEYKRISHVLNKKD